MQDLTNERLIKNAFAFEVSVKNKILYGWWAIVNHALERTEILQLIQQSCNIFITGGSILHLMLCTWDVL